MAPKRKFPSSKASSSKASGSQTKKMKRSAGNSLSVDVTKNFVNQKAEKLFDTLMSKDQPHLIQERGFDLVGLNSPYLDVIQWHGWEKFLKHPDPGVLSVVREFYSNAAQFLDEEGVSYVRAVKINFSAAALNEFFGLQAPLRNTPLDLMDNAADLDTVKEALCPYEAREAHFPIATGKLSKEARVWFRIVQTKLMPNKHPGEVFADQAIMIYCIIKKKPINVGKTIFRFMKEAIRLKRLWFPHLITQLCKAAGVQWDQREERVPPQQVFTQSYIDSSFKEQVLQMGRRDEGEVGQRVPSQGPESSASFRGTKLELVALQRMVNEIKKESCSFQDNVAVELKEVKEGMGAMNDKLHLLLQTLSHLSPSSRHGMEVMHKQDNEENIGCAPTQLGITSDLADMQVKEQSFGDVLVDKRDASRAANTSENKVTRENSERAKHFASEADKSGCISSLIANAPAKKKLVVLDVNGILVDIAEITTLPILIPQGKDVIAEIKQNTAELFLIQRGKEVYLRPHVFEFLKFCLERFEVGIWSSRMMHNLDPIVEFLLGKDRHRLLFCWDQSKCEKNEVSKGKINFRKNLKKVFHEYSEFTMQNSLLIDDSPDKLTGNEVGTCIAPPPYSHSNVGDKSLGEDGELRRFLEGVVQAADVPTYVRANPFGQEILVDPVNKPCAQLIQPGNSPPLAARWTRSYHHLFYHQF